MYNLGKVHVLGLEWILKILETILTTLEDRIEIETTVMIEGMMAEAETRIVGDSHRPQIEIETTEDVATIEEKLIEDIIKILESMMTCAPAIDAVGEADHDLHTGHLGDEFLAPLYLGGF